MVDINDVDEAVTQILHGWLTSGGNNREHNVRKSETQPAKIEFAILPILGSIPIPRTRLHGFKKCDSVTRAEHSRALKLYLVSDEVHLGTSLLSFNGSSNFFVFKVAVPPAALEPVVV